MAKLRISEKAELDIAGITRNSLINWGIDFTTNYLALIDNAFEILRNNLQKYDFRRVVRNSDQLRVLYLSSIKQTDQYKRIKQPVHCIYYRIDSSGNIEIVRILHQNMDIKRHLG